jgi:hypothetical protein
VVGGCGVVSWAAVRPSQPNHKWHSPKTPSPLARIFGGFISPETLGGDQVLDGRGILKARKRSPRAASSIGVARLVWLREHPMNNAKSWPAMLYLDVSLRTSFWTVDLSMCLLAFGGKPRINSSPPMLPWRAVTRRLCLQLRPTVLVGEWSGSGRRAKVGRLLSSIRKSLS